MDLKQIWDKALSEIELNISRANFITWFKNSRPLKKDDSKFIIACQNTFTKEWLENKYHKLIITALRNVDNEIKSVEFVIAPLEKEQASRRRNISKINLISQDQLDLSSLIVDKETQLNPKYTFENFIVGANNELAQAAALSICENPGTKYNPLFIYGGVGLGKTHLLQAIGNKVNKENPKAVIRYASCEKFTEELVEAIRNQTMSSFKKKFRQLDLLLIDDVQFLTGKDKSQEELFHTFNNLYEKNKQIVFTSDRPPKAIPSIEERLRSRFEGGMIADISYPDFETRLAILKTKAQIAGQDINEEILRYIAENIPKNVRELEGALNRIIAETHLKQAPLSLEETKKVLSSLLTKNNRYISVQEIIKKVASFYDLDEKLILSHSRKKELVKPRQVVMYLLREEFKYSFTNIAEKLGHRDHTTVIYACQKVSEEVKQDPMFSQEIILIKDLLYNK